MKSLRYYLKNIYLFLEREEGKEIERERNTDVCLLLMYPLLGTWPTTQACALTGNRTGNPLVCRPALNLLRHTNQGKTLFSNLGDVTMKGCRDCVRHCGNCRILKCLFCSWLTLKFLILLNKRKKIFSVLRKKSVIF